MNSTLVDLISALFTGFIDVINNFIAQSDLLFTARADFLLSFAGLGMVIVIFALTQYPKRLEESDKLKTAIYSREPTVKLPHHIIHVQAKKKYFRLLAIIEICGVPYFVAALTLAILITYPFPPTPPFTRTYVLISNFAYLNLLFPTVIITGYYIFYRIQYKLH